MVREQKEIGRMISIPRPPMNLYPLTRDPDLSSGILMEVAAQVQAAATERDLLQEQLRSTRLVE